MDWINVLWGERESPCVPAGIQADVDYGEGTRPVHIVYGTDTNAHIGTITSADYVTLCGQYRRAVAAPSPALAQGPAAMLFEITLREAGWTGRGSQAMKLMTLAQRVGVAPLDAARKLVEVHERAPVDIWRMPFAEAVARSIHLPVDEIVAWLRSHADSVRGYGGSQGAKMVAEEISTPTEKVVINLTTGEIDVFARDRKSAIAEAIRLLEEELHSEKDTEGDLE